MDARAILVVMGVAGSGKTTLARELAARLSWPFIDGDSLHPATNIEKMRAGIPLTDADRAPWLEAVAAWIDARRKESSPGIVTCSALKRSYRDFLARKRPEVHFVWLRASFALIHERVAHRKDHFMPPELLKSQFDTLEEPTPDEHPIIVDVGPPVEELAEEVLRRL